MNSYVPIPMPVVMPAAGGGPLPLRAAWVIGTMLLLALLGLSLALGYCAHLLWRADLKLFSIVLWAMLVAVLVVLPAMVIIGIFVPACGVTA